MREKIANTKNLVLVWHTDFHCQETNKIYKSFYNSFIRNKKEQFEFMFTTPQDQVTIKKHSPNN